MDDKVINKVTSTSSQFIILREWVFDKILHCVSSRNNAKTCGLLILGSSGSGKTTICQKLSNRNPHFSLKIQKLKSLLLSSHICSSDKVDSLNVAKFIYDFHRNLLNSKVFGEIYKENFISSGHSTLFLPENLCSFPDKAFKNGILLPLLSFSPPNENMYILIDSIDERLICNYIANDEFCSMNLDKLNLCQQGSKSIADLLSSHYNFFPEWLSLICTCRKESKNVIEKFMGFRKFYLDDLTKSYVVRDIQLYILNRIDNDESLKNIVNLETTEVLNLLHIKSNGYILYLEIILDAVIDNFLNIQVIKSIPGTLYGLYLWLFDIIFPNAEDFSILRNIFNIIMSSLTPLSEKEIFIILLNLDININIALIKDLIYKAKYFFHRTSDNCLILKHNSLSDWLLDVKHCTKRYKCSLIDGHSLLSVYNSYVSSKLTIMEVRNFGFYLKSSTPLFKMKGYHYAVWLLYTDCDLDIVGVLPNEKFGSLYDWNFDSVVKHLFLCISSQSNAISSFHKFSKYISNITSLYSKQSEYNKKSTSFHEATKANDYEAVSQLILKGMDVNITNDNGTTPLMIAGQHGFINICRLLLNVGASQLMTDRDGWTPLRLSIWSGHKAIVEVLIAHNTNTDFTGPDGRTALRTAAWIGRTDIALMLLVAGSDVNKSDSEGRTPLMAATYKGDLKMIKLLIKNGANVNHQDNEGRSAVFVAILCLNINEKHIQVIKLLIKHGSNINCADNDDMTPLLIASYEGHGSLCEILLENNADIDRTDRNSRFPLMAAAFSGHFDVVKLLLFWGAAIHCIDKAGYSVLSISASQGSIPILTELLARGLDEMHRDNCGLTPLHLAAIEGHIDSVNLLLNAGAKPNAIDNIGRIPLMLSCQEGHMEIIEFLLNKWPQSIDFRSFDGSTPLKIAVLNGLSNVVALLLEREEDYTIQDNNGRTPLHICVLQSQADCLKILINHSMLLKNDYFDIADEYGRTALHMSAWKEEDEILNLLIEAGCKIDYKDNEGRTALHLAAWQGNVTICKALIKFGSKVDEICSQGATALCIAAQEGHFDICILLINAGANVCHVDSFLRTPYKVAFKAGHSKICRVLEINGAIVSSN